MELIDWSKVLAVVVAGAIIVSGTWGLLALGAVLFRRRSRLVREKKVADGVIKHDGHLGHGRLTTPIGKETNGQPESPEVP